MSVKRFIVLDLEEAMVVRSALRAQKTFIDRRLGYVDCREFREVTDRVSARIDAKFKAHGIKLGFIDPEQMQP